MDFGRATDWGANSLVYGFKPSKTGEHTLTFTVKYDNQITKATLTRNIAVSGVDEVSVNIPVKCCEAAGKDLLLPEIPFTAIKYMNLFRLRDNS